MSNFFGSWLLIMEFDDCKTSVRLYSKLSSQTFLIYILGILKVGGKIGN
jgi:hypothetical protein